MSNDQGMANDQRPVSAPERSARFLGIGHGTSVIFWSLVIGHWSFLSLGGENKNSAIAASQVTLKQAAITLLDAFKEIEKQTGNAIEDWRPRRGQPMTNPTLALDLAGVSFWQALDIVAQKAGVRVYPHTGTASVGILAGPAGQLPVSYAGPFRVAVKRLTAVLDLESGNRYLEAGVELAWEPRYRPLLLKLGPEPVKAAGQNVPQTVRGDIRLVGQQAVELPLRLPLPARPAASLKQLEGVLRVLVAPGTHVFRFESPGASEAKEHRQAGVSVTLARFRAEPGVWTAVIELKYPPAALDLESHQIWAVQDTLRAEKDGKALPLKNLGRDVNVKEGNAIQITYRLGGALPSTKGVVLVYEAPAVPVLYPVKFSFQDLDLP